MVVKRLGELELSDFDESAVWRKHGPGCDDELVSPVPNKSQIGPADALCWVRCRASLADGTELLGIAMATSDPPDLGLLSFRATVGWVGLLLPPAPDFVLAKQGPEAFAAVLGRQLSQVFPMHVKSEVLDERTGQPFSRLIEWPRAASAC